MWIFVYCIYPDLYPSTTCIIAICAKVWNHVNLSIFASSEAKTCSTSIAMTRCSIFINLVVSESPRWYLLHNVYYKPRGLIIEFICERTSFETARPGAIFWLKFIHLKLDINIIYYSTVHRAKTFAEIGFFFAQKQGNEVAGFKHSLCSLFSSKNKLISAIFFFCAMYNSILHWYMTLNV